MVLLLGVLAACSDNSRPAPRAPHPMSPENASRPPTPQTWLDQVCSALGPAGRTEAPVPDVVVSDLPGSRDRVVAYLSSRIDAFDAAADGINAAGPAPTDGGQLVTEPVVRLLRERAATTTRLRADLQAVPDVAPQTLFETLTRVHDQMVLVGRAPVLRELALPPDLARSAATVPSCTALDR